MNLYLLQTALRAMLEPLLETLPLPTRPRQTRPEPGQAPTRPATVCVGSLPAKKEGGEYDAPLVLIQVMSGHEEDGCSCAVVALRIVIWNEDGEAGENDLLNLLGLLRRAVLACKQNPLADKYVLEPDERGHLAPWVRLDEQPLHFLEAYVLTNWKMQGFE